MSLQSQTILMFLNVKLEPLSESFLTSLPVFCSLSDPTSFGKCSRIRFNLGSCLFFIALGT